MVNVTEDYAEHYGFNAETKENLLDYFTFNIDVLQKFIRYFHDQAAGLIANVQSHPISLAGFLIKPINPAKNTLSFDGSNSRTDFEKALYDMNTLYCNLSPKEFNVLEKVARGLSSKEIANHYEISVRTVDAHIRNIKQKMNLHYKSDLRNLWNNLSFE